jgi:arylsulfatase
MFVECGVVWGEQALKTSGVSKNEAPELWEDELDLQKVWMGAKGRGRPEACV